MTATDRVRELVGPLLDQQGIELFDVVLAGTTLRVLVDRAAGVDLDTITEATSLVSHALDAADPIPGRYVLEVSSPGIERPLRTAEHFRRAVGSTVTVKTRPGTEGERRLDGVLESAGASTIVVAGLEVAYDDIERARTTFSWGPPARPGGPGTKKRAGAAATRGRASQTKKVQAPL